MASKRVTVFGGSGFLGRQIVKCLAAEGTNVRVAVRHPDMFDRVVQALHTLSAERDTEHSPPTK